MDRGKFLKRLGLGIAGALVGAKVVADDKRLCDMLDEDKERRRLEMEVKRLEKASMEQSKRWVEEYKSRFEDAEVWGEKIGISGGREVWMNYEV